MSEVIENRILIDDAVMLLRSKVNRLQGMMVAIEKAVGVSAISMDRVTDLYNQFHHQAEEIEEFVNMFYEVTARVLGYEVEEGDE